MSILAKETIDVIQPGDIIWWVEPFSLDFVTNAGKTDRFDLIVCVCVFCLLYKVYCRKMAAVIWIVVSYQTASYYRWIK